MAASLPWRRHQKPAQLSWLATESGGARTGRFVCHDDPWGHRIRALSTNSEIRAFFFDPGAYLAGRPRQCPGDPGLQLVLLSGVQAARAAFVAKARQALDALVLIRNT